MADRSRREYARNVRAYCAWLAATPDREGWQGDPLVDALARDHAARDFRRYLRVEKRAAASTVNLALASLDALYRCLEVGEEAETLELDVARARAGAREENLYLAGERLAARAASPATRRQYASIYRTFGDWLRGELARPPTTADLTADAIAAFARHLQTCGGRGGGPASPATRRIYVSRLHPAPAHYPRSVTGARHARAPTQAASSSRLDASREHGFVLG